MSVEPLVVFNPDIPQDMFFGSGGYVDDGCIIWNRCQECPLVVCIEDVGTTGVSRIGLAVQKTIEAGWVVEPRLESMMLSALSRRGGGVKRLRADSILELWDKGLNQTQISISLGCSVSRVGQLLRANGIRIGKGRRRQ